MFNERTAFANNLIIHYSDIFEREESIHDQGEMESKTADATNEKDVYNKKNKDGNSKSLRIKEAKEGKSNENEYDFDCTYIYLLYYSLLWPIIFQIIEVAMKLKEWMLAIKGIIFLNKANLFNNI
jgi:hypothetical protein